MNKIKHPIKAVYLLHAPVRAFLLVDTEKHLWLEKEPVGGPFIDMDLWLFHGLTDARTLHCKRKWTKRGKPVERHFVKAEALMWELMTRPVGYRRLHSGLKPKHIRKLIKQLGCRLDKPGEEKRVAKQSA